MPFATFSIAVQAPVEVLWAVLLEKVEDPAQHTANVLECEVREQSGPTRLRWMRTVAGEVSERITVDAARLRVDTEIVEHPQYSGFMVKKIGVEDGDLPVLTYTLDWEPKTAQLEGQDLTPLVMTGVRHTQKIAEARAKDAE